MFNNFLDGSIEYYKRNSSDLLYDLPIALSNGLNSFPTNVGDMFNSGLELGLTANYELQEGILGGHSRFRHLPLKMKLPVCLIHLLMVLSDGLWVNPDMNFIYFILQVLILPQEINYFLCMS